MSSLPSRRVVVSCVALAGLYVLTVRLAVTPVDDGRFGYRVLGPGATLALWAVAALQALPLLTLWRALRERPPRGAEIALLTATGVALVAFSLTVPLPSSDDPWAYLGYAKLAHFADAYRPPAVPFPAPFGAVNRIWGLPIPPCVYGPLWLAVDRAVLAPVHDVAQALLVLRLVDVAALALLIGALALAGLRLELLVLVALNPAIMFDFVIGAHNDLQALAVVALALAAVRRNLWPAAVALVIAAASIKISFGIVGLLVFARPGPPGRRVAAAASAIAGTLATAFAFGGAPYVAAMRSVGASGARELAAHHHLELVTHDLCIALALAATAAALLFNLRLRAATWSFWTVGTTWFSWYLSWCLPYALVTPRVTLPFLAAWPFAAMTIAHGLPFVNPMYAVLAAAAVELARRRARLLLLLHPAKPAAAGAA